MYASIRCYECSATPPYIPRNACLCKYRKMTTPSSKARSHGIIHHSFLSREKEASLNLNIDCFFGFAPLGRYKMDSSQSSRISSLIRKLSAIEQQSNGSIYENENLRTDAAHLVRKLAVALERPHEVVLMNSSIVFLPPFSPLRSPC